MGSPSSQTGQETPGRALAPWASVCSSGKSAECSPPPSRVPASARRPGTHSSSWAQARKREPDTSVLAQPRPYHCAVPGCTCTVVTLQDSGLCPSLPPGDPHLVPGAPPLHPLPQALLGTLTFMPGACGLLPPQPGLVHGLAGNSGGEGLPSSNSSGLSSHTVYFSRLHLQEGKPGASPSRLRDGARGP